MNLGTGAWKVSGEQKPYAEGEVSMATLEAGTTQRKPFSRCLENGGTREQGDLEPLIPK